MYPCVIWRVRGKFAEQYIQRHFRSVPMVIDNNYTLSVCCCVDIIISLNSYCTSTDADDMFKRQNNKTEYALYCKATKLHRFEKDRG